MALMDACVRYVGLLRKEEEEEMKKKIKNFARHAFKSDVRGIGKEIHRYRCTDRGVGEKKGEKETSVNRHVLHPACLTPVGAG